MKIPLAFVRVVSKFPCTVKVNRWLKVPLATLVAASLFGVLAQPAGALTLTGAAIGTGSGSVTPTGTNSFTVNGTGAGVWYSQYSSDSAYCAFTTATGDVEIVARLVSFSFPATQSEAGLVIRNSLAPSEVNRASTFYSARTSGPNYLAYAGGGPLVNGDPFYFGRGVYYARGVNPPYWLKLVRMGNNFGAYWSLDGRDWSLINGSSGGVSFGTGAFNVGLFVSSGGSGTLATAVFDNVYVGAPRLKYKTSWVGSTSGGVADGHPSNNIFALWVKDDGTCYANGNWDESGQCVKAYKDGKVAFALPFGNSGLTEGTITGNSTNLFVATGNQVYRTDFNGNNSVAISFTSGLGAVGGLAASSDRLFVSDATNNNVRIVDLTMSPPTQIGLVSTAGNIAHPGPIAFDGTNFWITDCGSAFPLSYHVATQAGYTPAIKCFGPTGGSLGRVITGVSNPTALAKHPTMDRLYVCDNGPSQNIRYYTGLATATPIAAGTFGQDKGLWQTVTGSHPGQITDSGFGGDKRFYGLTGVGFDSGVGGGNIYVACDGVTGSGTDLRKFDTGDNLVWKLFGLEFVNTGDFDPGSDTIYTTEERFNMNYANTAPGSEWSYTAFTANPFQANDLRNDPNAKPHGVQVRRLVGNNVFMYTNGMGTAEPCYFYRFNNQGTTAQGTTAIPFGSLLNVSGGFKLWIDTNGDGLVTTTAPSEESTIPSALGGYQSYDVDSQGDIWLVMTQSGDFTRSTIGRLSCTGTQSIGSPAVASVPAYSAANYQNFGCPEPIKTLYSIKYDRANDVMYCMGQKADGKWALARYDKWLASSAATPDEHTARYVIPLPDLGADLTIMAPPGDTFWAYTGMAVAGDKIFIADVYGPIRVYDASLGNPVITLNSGPEISATSAWEDMRMGLNAFKRSNGEYLILEENDGWHGSVLLYRSTPTADTTLPGAPTLTATRQGHAIALAWTGAPGTPTSYNIYRGLTSGSLSLYQSNVTASFFLDTNVTPGTTYYYTVAAVSGVGTGAQSNQVSTAPVSAQAEFVKYDTTTKGNWSPTGTRIYGSEGYYISGNPDLTGVPAYVASWTPGQVEYRAYSVTPDSLANTDSRALQMPSGTGRTSAYFGTSQVQQWHDITFSAGDIASGKWHQVSIYLLDWANHPQWVNVEVVDLTTGAVLDSRQPMDYHDGKWLVWNVRGNVKIRLSAGLGYYPVLSGIFFDPVQTPAPTLGWWKLDDTSGILATDSSGAGNHAGKNAGTWTAGAHTGPGGFNGCVTFGGTNYTSDIGIPGFNPPNSSTLTYAMWFKTSTSGLLLAMWNPPADAPTAFAPVLYVGTDNKLHGAFYTGVVQNMKSTASVNDNTWHHAALTSDGQVQKLYLDGEVVGLLSALVLNVWGGSYYFHSGYGYVTGWPNTTGTVNYFNGLVDDMRLYNRVLPNAEIWRVSHP